MNRFRYRIGARVRILIGHPVWSWNSAGKSEEERLVRTDIRSDLVGKSATVKIRTLTQGIESYGLQIDDVGYVSWFYLNQIERI
jgi:hypothetical protein